MSAVSNPNSKPKISVSDFLAAFYPDSQEQIHLRSFKPKGAPDTVENRPATYVATRAELTFSTALKQRLMTANRTRGIYFVVNAGGNSDKDITRYNAFFAESDTLSMEEQHAALDAAPLPTSIRNETKKSVHAYWLIEGGCSEAEWREVQERLIAYFDGDNSIKNPSRTMRVPSFNHVTYDVEEGYTFKPVEVVAFEPSRRYTVAQMKEAFPAPKPKEKLPMFDVEARSSDSHFETWEVLNAELQRRIMRAGKLNRRGIYETKGICHNGQSNTAIMFSPATGAVKCMAGCTHEQLLEAFHLPKKPDFPRLIIGGRSIRSGDLKGHRISDELISILINAPTTDAGNAECMSALYGDTMRYCHTRKAWLLWDGIRWRVDIRNEVVELAVNMVRARQEAALTDSDFQTKRQVVQWGLTSENINRVEAAMKFATAIKPFRTTIDQYDADALLAATENGTLDLRDGTFRESNPEDYLTMQLGTSFMSDAKAPRWGQFLREVFDNDEELIEYIRRAVGYSLTGETKEQNLFLCYGSGANGKSVFLQIISQLLGDYAGAASFETFNAGNRNEAGYDLAVLKGKRLVTVIEANEDRFLDEAKVKAVTGQDLITCRFLHKNFFTYRPQFKIWMAMNHKPIIRGTDHGIWRRIHLIPFTQSFEGRADKDLVAKLSSELPGILNWALAGLRKWQDVGLEIPKAVKDATEEYQRESDSIGQWIEERTIQNPIGQLRAGEDYKDYSAWALERGERPFGLKTWSRSLIERGYKNSRNNRGVHYFGLELDGLS
jgi:P4 family phage/plasmid primase-like protien